MAYRWPDATVFSRLACHVEEPWGQTGGGRLRLGHRRFARHWAVGQSRTAWAATYQMRWSDDASARSLHRYHQRRAARQPAPPQRAAA
jgi:hypothetical protein